jgi:hypothetical protein
MTATLENNGKECSKKEFLDIEIFQHFKKVYSYIIWNHKHLLGEVVEDNIMKLLNKEQLVDFYFYGKNKFKIEKCKLDAYLNKDDK